MTEIETVRHCPECQEQGTDRWKFCALCGANMSVENDLDGQSTSPQAPPSTGFGGRSRDAVSIRLWSELDKALTSSQLTLIVLGALGLITVILLYVLNASLDSAIESRDLGRAQNIDRILAWGIQPLMLATLVAAILTLVRWTSLSYQASQQIGTADSALGRRAAAAWFVPLVNLVVPPIAMHNNWVSARRSNKKSINPWIAIWPLFLGVGVFLAIVGAVKDGSGLVDSIRANTWSGIGYALASIGVLVLAFAMKSVSLEQRGALPHPPPVPNA